jgi:type VI secretion system protein ImpK
MNRVTQITQDCFEAVRHLRRTEPSSLPAPEVLHHELCGLVEALIQNAGDAGLSAQDAQDVAYALVALLDEVMLSRPEPYRQYWMGHSLQLRFFKENVAGEVFFTKLQALRAEPRRREVLRVYFECLALGFRGRYGLVDGLSELPGLMDAVGRELERSRDDGSDRLSPHGDRPTEALLQVRRSVPLLAISAGAVLLALTVMSCLSWSLSNDTERVTQMARSLPSGASR